MEIHLYSESEDMQLPVLPASFEVSDDQNNETVVIHTQGEVNLLGKSGLRTMEITSMFPANDYAWLDVDADEPFSYIDTLKKWKDDGKIIGLHITDTDIKWNVTIESLKYSEDDATGDVSYTISLKEYRSLEVRVTKKIKTINYTVKNGDTLAKIAYKYLGATKYKKQIYEQNKKVIEKMAKKKGKTSSKHGKYLYKGTKLVIKETMAS
jgi:nucleoid-associated protein YgaU